VNIEDPPTLNRIDASHFQAHLERDFSLIDGAGATLPLTLVQVAERPGATPSWAKRTSFTLLFRGPAEPVWPQGLYALAHPEAGRLEPLLVVPVTGVAPPDEAAQYYEIVFG